MDALFTELQDQGIDKPRLLRHIKIIYDKIVSKYILDQNNRVICIRTNADKIFDDVVEKLLDMTDKLAYCAVVILVVYAFVSCRVLEKPR